jgi:hypothetical protein
MAYTSLAYPDVLQQLHLTQIDQRLFVGVPDWPLNDFQRQWLQRGELITNTNSTKKARSEFLIAPLLLMLHFRDQHPIRIYPGHELTVDAANDLNGVCDFIISRGPQSRYVQAPILAIIEAKNALLTSGYGQCIAVMVAARELILKAKMPNASVAYGCSSMGIDWYFLHLAGDQTIIDSQLYFISQLG